LYCSSLSGALALIDDEKAAEDAAHNEPAE